MAEEEKNQAEEKKITVADPLAGAAGENEKLAEADGQTLKTIKIKAPEKPDEHARNAAILKDVAGSLEKANVIDTSDIKATTRISSAKKAAEAKATGKLDVDFKDAIDAKATVKLPTPPPAEDKATVQLSVADAAPSDEKATTKLPLPENSTNTVKISRPKNVAPPVEVAKKKAPEAKKTVAPVQPSDLGAPKSSAAPMFMIAVATVVFGVTAIWTAMQYFN